MDYRELNEHVDVYKTNTYKHKSQVSGDRKDQMAPCWTYTGLFCKSTLTNPCGPFKGQRYYLTYLGFGLNVASLIMRSIVYAMVSQDETVNKATSSYINDMFVNTFVCALRPEQLRSDTHGLGLHTWKKFGKLR